MNSLLVKPNARYGTVIDITPENAEWSFVGFKVVKLKAQETHEFETNDREFCLVPITGTFDAQLSDCLLYTSPSPRDMRRSRMPSSA